MSLGVPIPFLSPARTVLIITDDALGVYSVEGSRVSLVEIVPWRGAGFEEKVADILSKDAGGRSVVILNDAVEQHYRKEKVPHITLLDRANVVRRRLMVAFPHYSTRAAMALKGGGGGGLRRAAKGVPADGQVYLFAAVPPTDAFAKLLGAITISGVVVEGYGLLPVESADFVKKLAEKIASKNGVKDTATWSILIGQHHGGGLRQVVVKNGELALTRITPIPVPEDVDAGHWAGDVAHELQATLSYLTRFGYAPDDGLNVIVVGNTFYGEQLEEMVTVPCSYHALSATEAGDLLGIKVSGDNVHYADVLHAAWAAKKARLTLPMISNDLKRISAPRKIASVAMVLLTLGFGYEAFSLSSEAQSLYMTARNMDVARERKAEIDKIYQAEIDRKEALGIDVRLIQSALAISRDIKAQTANPLNSLDKISRELGTLRVDELEFENTSVADAGNSAGQPASPATGSAPARAEKITLKFSFAGTIKPQDGNKELYDLKDRLTKVLPDYDVTVSKELVDLSYTGEISSEVGLTANQRQATDRFTGEIQIQKRVANAENSGA